MHPSNRPTFLYQSELLRLHQQDHATALQPINSPFLPSVGTLQTDLSLSHLGTSRVSGPGRNSQAPSSPLPRLATSPWQHCGSNVLSKESGITLFGIHVLCPRTRYEYVFQHLPGGPASVIAGLSVRTFDWGQSHEISLNELDADTPALIQVLAPGRSYESAVSQ